eukprot:638-Eustigmatos_ZCMA.PRE.1
MYISRDARQHRRYAQGPKHYISTELRSLAVSLVCAVCPVFYDGAALMCTISISNTTGSLTGSDS